jgi:hypothetical protein
MIPDDIAFDSPGRVESTQKYSLNWKMEKSVSLFHWIPRILCILAILFVSLFAFDSFAPGLSFWQQIAGFLIHLIPSFILLAMLLVAWKWEFTGGIIFIILGIGLSPWLFYQNYKMNHSVGMSLGIIFAITIPFALVGLLFLISHSKKKKMVNNH